jgi:hypothetical protein
MPSNHGHHVQNIFPDHPGAARSIVAHGAHLCEHCAARPQSPTTKQSSISRLSMSSVVDPPATTSAAVENKVLWSPSEASMKETAMCRFPQETSGATGDACEDLWKWSVDHSDEF